jgi:predicted site-specific integrase-resolvase
LPEWIDTKQLCEWLNVTPQTAYNWRQQGLPYIGQGKAIRYNKEEIEKWLRERAEIKKNK